ncbi:MAG: transposase [Candidatus Izemoplasmatales bacterium]|jgi:hypothetical protein
MVTGLPIYIYRNKRGNGIFRLLNGKHKELNEENIKYQKEVIHNLNTDLGIELRIKRSIQVEGAFGIIKDVFKTRRFRRFGTENVRLEFFLVAIGYNLTKFHNKKFRIIE